MLIKFVILIIYIGLSGCGDTGEYSARIKSTYTKPSHFKAVDYRSIRHSVPGSNLKITGIGFQKGDYLKIDDMLLAVETLTSDYIISELPADLLPKRYAATIVSAGADFSGQGIREISKPKEVNFDLEIISEESFPDIYAITKDVVANQEDGKIIGRNLTDSLDLFVNDKSIPYKVLSTSEIAFKLENHNIKRNTLEVQFKGEVLFSTSLILVDRELPKITMSPEEVCTGVEYYDGMGQYYEGSADCSPESLEYCTDSNEVGCVTTSTYVSLNKNDLVAADIRSGKLLLGVTGTLIAESHINCNSGGASGCIATATYPSMNLTAAGTDSSLTAANFDASVATAGNFEFWLADGSRQVITGDGDLVAASIASGVEVHGVTGSANLESHSNCNSGGANGCVATATYPSMNLTAAGTDSSLTAANFDASVATAGNFEFWLADGSRQGDHR